ncbi:MAG: PIN domain-containing protein [Actinobacteria bacterium ATB1]|nr:PIN domain-containing protein [Actinobacteria bacterium ATB1]
MVSVFVDTSAWYAAADTDDASHDRATARLEEFAGHLVTSDHVLIETWYLTAARLRAARAEELVNLIRRGIARVESAQLADLEVAATIAETFPDQGFSIVDRTSWAVMERLGIHDAIAFQTDYAIYRFGPGRRRAFTVHS